MSAEIRGYRWQHVLVYEVLKVGNSSRSADSGVELEVSLFCIGVGFRFQG